MIVPAGVFLTGAIRLKSNVNLHVSKGATLKFSMDPKAYLPVVHTRWEGMELMHISPLIYAYEETNIAITGEGTLDGQGKSFFWKWHGNPRYGGNPDVISQRAARAKLYEYDGPKRARRRTHFWRRDGLSCGRSSSSRINAKMC